MDKNERFSKSGTTSGRVRGGRVRGASYIADKQCIVLSLLIVSENHNPEQ